MSLETTVARGLEVGSRQTTERVARTEARRAARAPFQGYLVLEGDSWFSYPLFDEVTEALRDDFNYNTRSSSHHGDTAQEIAYLPNQVPKFEALFEDLAHDQHVARAILLSCGGNDVKDALSALMNAKASGLPVWHPAVVEAVVQEQVPLAIGTLVGRAVALSERHFREKRPVLLHGYGNPVPDGRGYKLLFTFSGPWMKPVFARKGYVSGEDQPRDELQENVDAMQELMALSNETVLPGIRDAANSHYGADVVHYVDVREELSSELDHGEYEEDWANELHPTGGGFRKVARRIHEAIVRAAPTIPADLSWLVPGTRRTQMRRSALAAGLVAVVLTSANCAARRVNQFRDFAEAGRVYSEAMNELTEEAGNAAIEADSAVLLASRGGFSETERIEKLEEHDEALGKLLEVLGDLRRHTMLLRRYFVTLGQLAGDDVPSGIAERASALVGDIQKLGPQLANARVGGAEVSSLVGPAASFVVGTFQAKALEAHLKAHTAVLERELEIQGAVVQALAESVKADLDVVLTQAETDGVARPYVSSGEIPTDWAERRRLSINAGISLDSVERAVSASEELKRLFLALVEGKATEASASELLADINAVLDLIEKVRGAS